MFGKKRAMWMEMAGQHRGQGTTEQHNTAGAHPPASNGLGGAAARDVGRRFPRKSSGGSTGANGGPPPIKSLGSKAEPTQSKRQKMPTTILQSLTVCFVDSGPKKG